MLRRGLAYTAAAVIIGAVCAALVQIAAQILSFSSPVVVVVVATLAAAAVLHALRRRMRAVARHRSGPRNPHGVQR